MKQFNVTGMSCAACSSRVEKAVSAVQGVTSCSVSLLTNSMGVEGTGQLGRLYRSLPIRERLRCSLRLLLSPKLAEWAAALAHKGE